MKDIFKRDLKELAEIKKTRNKIEEKIKMKTTKLQQKLQEEKDKENYLNKSFEKYWKDENNHIMKRIYLWLKYRDDWDDITTISRELEIVFDVNQLHRFQTYDVRDRTLDFIHYTEIGTDRMKGFTYQKDFDDNWIKDFDKLRDKDKKDLLEGLSAVIEFDLTEFTYDW